jgi:hypothetical protein
MDKTSATQRNSSAPPPATGNYEKSQVDREIGNFINLLANSDTLRGVRLEALALAWGSTPLYSFPGVSQAYESARRSAFAGLQFQSNEHATSAAAYFNQKMCSGIANVLINHNNFSLHAAKKYNEIAQHSQPQIPNGHPEMDFWIPAQTVALEITSSLTSNSPLKTLLGALYLSWGGDIKEDPQSGFSKSSHNRLKTEFLEKYPPSFKDTAAAAFDNAIRSSVAGLLNTESQLAYDEYTGPRSGRSNQEIQQWLANAFIKSNSLPSGTGNNRSASASSSSPLAVTGSFFQPTLLDSALDYNETNASPVVISNYLVPEGSPDPFAHGARSYVPNTASASTTSTLTKPARTKGRATPSSSLAASASTTSAPTKPAETRGRATPSSRATASSTTPATEAKPGAGAPQTTLTNWREAVLTGGGDSVQLEFSPPLDLKAIFDRIQQRLDYSPIVTSLSFKDCHIGDDGTVLIARIAEMESPIKHIDVEGNDITQKGMETLAGAIKNNENLKSINLSRNPIADGGAKVLANALKHNYTLNSINLSQCWITNVGAAEIRKIVNINRTVTFMDMSGNFVSALLIENINQDLQRNRKASDH